MANAKSRTRHAVVNKGEGTVTFSFRSLYSAAPIIILLITTIVTLAISRDHLQTAEKRIDRLETASSAQTEQLIKSSDDHAILLKIRDDIDKLKRKAGID